MSYLPCLPSTRLLNRNKWHWFVLSKVEVTHGDEKQVIALPAERLDCTKRYFVTFTVRGESQGTTKSSHSMKRSATSV